MPAQTAWITYYLAASPETLAAVVAAAQRPAFEMREARAFRDLCVFVCVCFFACTFLTNVRADFLDVLGFVVCGLYMYMHSCADLHNSDKLRKSKSVKYMCQSCHGAFAEEIQH